MYVINKNKLLLSRRANTGWLDGHLCAPGGHVEKGESPTIAMKREIEEELGVKVLSADLEFLCVAARNSSPTEYVAYEFVVRNKDYKFYNAEPEKCSELVWVDLDDLSDDIIPDFRAIIEQGILGKKPYFEVGY